MKKTVIVDSDKYDDCSSDYNEHSNPANWTPRLSSTGPDIWKSKGSGWIRQEICLWSWLYDLSQDK
jgi:hypothetical protein